MIKLLEEKGILAYCDGAASGNPGPAGWGALLCLPDGVVRELGGGSPRATNNQMELTAAIEALRALVNVPGDVTLATDSQYLISGATQWLSGWKRRDWKTAQGGDVLNRDLWEALDELIRSPRFSRALKWQYVPGHSGVPGNDRVDEIAVAFSKGSKPSLYQGPLASYRHSLKELLDFNARFAAPSSNARSKMPALHYLSLLDGIPMRHAKWAECEARVKGKSGAKFKKVTSPEEEKQILAQWGVKPF